MAREDGMMAGRETVVASASLETRTESPARAAPWIAVARFARRKPLGALGGLIVLALVATALLAPLISPYDSRQIIREANTRVPVYVPPGSAYPMGTDLVVQRVVDAMMAVPGLIIVLAIMAVLGSSLNNVIIAIVIGMLAPVVRTVRSQVLSVKEMEYVVAARAIGARSTRIIVRHIMPNCLAIYLILATYYLGFAIILEASLSFLGVGVPPDVPSWGGMLTAAAQGHITKAPWAGIFPGLAIFIVVLGFNLLGDALRDVLEPRLRGAGPAARLTR